MFNQVIDVILIYSTVHITRPGMEANKITPPVWEETMKRTLDAAVESAFGKEDAVSDMRKQMRDAVFPLVSSIQESCVKSCDHCLSSGQILIQANRSSGLTIDIHLPRAQLVAIDVHPRYQYRFFVLVRLGRKIYQSSDNILEAASRVATWHAAYHEWLKTPAAADPTALYDPDS
jgi:hypothetical protein